MHRAFDKVIHLAATGNTSYRIAAYILAIEKVVRAGHLRGIYQNPR